jgi:tetratricopeptide (TPR) repeat protein
VEGDYRPEALYRYAWLAEHDGRLDEAQEAWRTIAAETTNPHRAEAFYWLGRSSYDAGRYDEAAEALSQALTLALPKDDVAAAAGFLAGLVERERGRLGEAERYLTAMLLNRPDHASALSARRILGWVLLERGNPEEAARRFRRILDETTDPEIVLRSRYGLVRAAAARGDAEAVSAALKALPPEAAAGPWLGWAWADYGWVLFSKGEYAAAQKAYRTALEAWRDVDEGTVRYMEAEGLFRLGRYAEAADRFEEVKADNGVAPAAYFRAGVSARQAGDDARAARLLEKVIALYPAYSERDRVRVELGEIKLKLKRPDEARRAFEEVSADSPLYAEALHARARIALEAERWDEATELFTKFRVMFPDDPRADEAALALARAHFQRKALPAALAVLDELEKKTASPQTRTAARYYRGWMLVRGGQPEKGHAVLEELTAADPEGPFAARAFYILGGSDFEAKRYEGALSRFEAVIRLGRGGPEETEALRGRADCLFALGRYDKALAAYMALGDTTSGLYGKALSLQRLGRLKEFAAATDYFERAAPADERRNELRMLLGQAFLDDGQPVEAAEQFERAERGMSEGDALKARLLRGRSLVAARRDGEAAAVFTALAKDAGPTGREALRELSELYGRRGEYQRAASLSAELAAEEGSGPEVLSAYSRASYFARKAALWDEAAAHAEKALALVGPPSAANADARRAIVNDLGESLLGKGAAQSALEALRAAALPLKDTEAGAEGLRSLILLGQALEANGLRDEALETYLRIGFLYPLQDAKAAEVTLRAADLLKESDRLPEARSLYEKLKEQAPAPLNETAAARLSGMESP